MGGTGDPAGAVGPEQVDTYDDGAVRARFHLKDGKLHGPYAAHNPNGSTMMRATFSNGALEGQAVMFDGWIGPPGIDVSRGGAERRHDRLPKRCTEDAAAIRTAYSRAKRCASTPTAASSAR
jgi:hypothetical protein